MTIARGRVALLAVTLVLAASLPAAAQRWNERTFLTFSEPTMVPGATLEPGKYEFILSEPMSDRHVVQIRGEDQRVVATAHAIPAKRIDPKGETFLVFRPTTQQTDAPVALKAWYYPASLYGHEFVYPEDEARKIAEGSKEVVLSADAAGTDARGARIRIIDAEGNQKEWTGDQATMREWEDWRERQPTTGREP